MSEQKAKLTDAAGAVFQAEKRELGPLQRVLDDYAAHGGDGSFPNDQLDDRIMAMAARVQAAGTSQTNIVEMDAARNKRESASLRQPMRWRLPASIAAGVTALGLGVMMVRQETNAPAVSIGESAVSTSTRESRASGENSDNRQTDTAAAPALADGQSASADAKESALDQDAAADAAPEANGQTLAKTRTAAQAVSAPTDTMKTDSATTDTATTDTATTDTEQSAASSAPIYVPDPAPPAAVAAAVEPEIANAPIETTEIEADTARRASAVASSADAPQESSQDTPVVLAKPAPAQAPPMAEPSPAAAVALPQAAPPAPTNHAKAMEEKAADVNGLMQETARGLERAERTRSETNDKNESEHAQSAESSATPALDQNPAGVSDSKFALEFEAMRAALKRGDQKGAKRLLRQFKRTHPNVILPPDLQAWLQELR
jgi:hypothetical protein